MTTVSPELQRALDSSCATGVDELLQARRPEDLEALRALVSLDPGIDPSWRQNAIYLLGRFGDTGAAGQILGLLPRLDERERINAVTALGQIGTDEAIDGVLNATRDPSPDVRRFAAYALARADTPTARERLDDLASSDPVEFVRDAAVQARGASP